MQILRVHMGRLAAAREDLTDDYRPWAGRGLTAKVLYSEVPPTCAPLGAENKLIIANGLLAGTRTSSAGRISVGAKSPLTGGIKESNAGGTAGDTMARLGLRAIILEGSPLDNSLYLLKVGQNTAELIPANEYRGLGTYALAEKLRLRFGKNIAFICIGQAGEHKLAGAGVAVSDAEGFPTRYAGRGGMGAVMGAKGIKAILLEDVRGDVPICDREAFRQAVKRYTSILLENPGTGRVFPELGTIAMLDNIHKLGGVPTRNFREGTFDEHYPKLCANGVRNTILERGGDGTPTHSCMPGCVIRCSNVFPDAEGKRIVSPLEYENLVMLGPNLGIFSLDEVARLNYLCNDYGLDTIETGVAIGVAMEAGVLAFGDAAGAIKLLHEAAEGTVLGRVIGNGGAITGKVLGVARVPAVKGQGIPAYDPRAIKGMGVTYLTSPMGADHTAGHTYYTKVDHHLPEGQIEASRNSQIVRAAYDAICICAFALGALGPAPDIVTDLINAVHGTTYAPSFIADMGKEILRTELLFNREAGFTKADNRYPDFFHLEKLPPFDLVFDVTQDDVDRLVDELAT